MKNVNTIYTKKSNLDQFYTSDKIVKFCYDEVKKRYSENDFSLFLEPSAGVGAFLKVLPESKREGIDLEPKDNEIKKMDFFNYVPTESGKIFVIGNPPFGRVASLAVKFFNYAAEFAQVIAFVIPKTFQKKSLQNKLNRNFHLKYNINLPKNSFVLDGKPYNVPCCFQIWEKSDNKRKITKVNLENDYFEFVTKDTADLAVRRVGGRAGKATVDFADTKEVSHYYLKVKKRISALELSDMINSVNFDKIRNSTAGVKSISKPEFVSGVLRKMK
jgi:hypothetical protein